MSLESEVFENVHFNPEKGLKYGFRKENESYIYSTTFLDGSFQAEICVEKEKVIGKVIEVDLGEEYINMRIDSFKGEFVAKVRESYFEILHDIKRACFDANPFLSKQANRISKYIESKYKVVYDNPFEEEGIQVFRNQKNQKWFGLMMSLHGKRFEREGKIEVLNVKLEPEHILQLIGNSGFYLAYHMDKKNWISLVLDDTLEDSIVCQCIDESYSLVNARQYWIVPANPKYYDIFSHFEHNKEITWKQTTKVNVDDIVYIYVTQPYRCILYKCLVTQVDIPYSYQDKNLSMKKIMKCRLLHTYKQDEITMDILSEIGIPNIRCTRKVSYKQVKAFDK